MSHVLVQLVIELVGVGSREHFCLRCLREQRQRCWRKNCFGKLFQTKVAAAEKPLPPMVARRVCEIDREIDWLIMIINNQRCGRRRAKLLTCVDIRDSLKLTRQVLM